MVATSVPGILIYPNLYGVVGFLLLIVLGYFSTGGRLADLGGPLVVAFLVVVALLSLFLWLLHLTGSGSMAVGLVFMPTLAVALLLVWRSTEGGRKRRRP